MRCPSCQSDNADGVSRCTRCGQIFVELTPPPASGEGKAPPKAKSKKRVYILIVEDDEACAKVISDYLELQGIPWRTECADAMQAVIQAQSLPIGIILMDIMLPRFGSGVDAYKTLRQSPYLSKDIPIIFYTAMNEEKARSMVPKDPKVRLLFKPLDLEMLLKTIRELTGNLLF